MNLDQFFKWEKATRDTIDVKKIYIDVADDLVAGVLLSQIAYWFLPSKEGKTKLRVQKDGFLWLAKGRDDWWEECRIKPRQFDTAVNKLIEKQIVIKTTYKFDGNPMIHIRINWRVFLSLLKIELDKLEILEDDSNMDNAENLDFAGYYENVKTDLQVESLENTGFNRNVKTDLQICNSDLADSVKSITESTSEINYVCMESASAPSTHKSINDSDREDQELMKAIYEGCQSIELPGYFDEFYQMLKKCFDGRLSTEIINNAFILYRTKMAISYNRLVNIKNPTGWLHDAYKDALLQYKATRYITEQQEKERILEEMNHPSQYTYSGKH